MLEISLGSTTVYNTGGGCMVLFINVLSDGKLKQISYDGDVIVGLDCLYQESEDGILPENQLWYAYDWQSLIDIVGCKVALDISRRVTKNWKWSDNMPMRKAVYGIENMIDMIDRVSMLDSTWSSNLECCYPFEKPFDEMLLDIFSWQNAVLNQEPPMYQRLKKLVQTDEANFMFNGSSIFNPFYDIDCTNAVDPIEYYGFDNIYKLAGRSYNC